MKTLILASFISSCLLAATAGTANNSSAATEGMAVETSKTSFEALKETSAQREARMHWWHEAKFGLFIHWGVYAVPAGKYGDSTNYGEWIMHNATIPVAKYQEFAHQFNPVKYNPELWAQTAKDAGMKWSAKTTQVNHPVNMIMLAEMRFAPLALGRVIPGPFRGMAYPDQQRQSAFGYDLPRYGSTIPGPYHGSRWNYLSCDGHVQLMKGSDTVLNGVTSSSTFMWDRNN